jgi:AIPR protein
VTTDALMKEIEKELDELRQQYPALKREDLFLTWFLRAYVTDDVEASANAITNGPGDKGVDAVLIDDRSRSVFVVQGKYRHSAGTKNELHNDVTGFAECALILQDGKGARLRAMLEGADSIVVQKLTEARKRLSHHDYRLWLYYVTLGKCSPNLRKEAEDIVRTGPGVSNLEVLDAPRLSIVMRDYLDGVAPPIPSLDLPMESGHGISVNGILQRFDSRSKIESWVFSMRGDTIADLYEGADRRLFARNIRGFLGEGTDVNRSMESTLRDEPERFFYYNNGITILCDDAERVSAQGRDILRVSNPQVINGQQTTRTLTRKRKEAAKASVIVRVIQVPRGQSDGQEEFDALVSQIVEGTNWQNRILPSDLVSNDRRQIELHRELRKRGYLYLRKRESKGEARRGAGNKRYILVRKEDFARAVAGSDLDPVEARSGVENLFDDVMYRQIFPTSAPEYYLTRYWLMREVTKSAHGYPARAYAKWLVLGFIWSRLTHLLRGITAKVTFIRAMELSTPDFVDPLSRAVDKAFDAALTYWRLNSGKGARRTDVSTFFRNKRGRHKEFESFWRGRRNRNRERFNNAWTGVAAFLEMDSTLSSDE